jgi:hypothetical protein
MLNIPCPYFGQRFPRSLSALEDHRAVCGPKQQRSNQVVFDRWLLWLKKACTNKLGPMVKCSPLTNKVINCGYHDPAQAGR